MPFGTPADPVSGTVITVAYAVANLLTPLRWLRGLTGNADPPGTDYCIVSDTTTGATWRKVPAAALATGAAAGNVGTGGVTTAMLATDAVTAEKIGDDAILANHVADLQIVTQHIAASQVTEAKLANDAVTAAKLADDAVVSANLSDDCVLAEHIADAQILTAHIVTGQVTADKLGTDAVISSKIGDDAVLAAHIADAQIVAAHLTDNSVTERTLDVIDTPANNDVLTFDAPSGRMEWQAMAAISAGTALVGSIMLYGATSMTAANAAGWYRCDGSPASRTTYATLFGVIGTTFGAGDGSTTFNLPDLRNRVPVGAGSLYTLGTAVGAATVDISHAHSTPNHAHSGADLTVSGTTGTPSASGGTVSGTPPPSFGTDSHTHGAGSLDVSGNTANDGAGSTGGNLSATQSIVQPSLPLSFIIYAGA